MDYSNSYVPGAPETHRNKQSKTIAFFAIKLSDNYYWKHIKNWKEGKTV